jgi:leukotriene-A4 hydrolase
MKTVFALPLLLLFASLLCITACKRDNKSADMNHKEPASPTDVHSYARPDAVITHANLDLTVDFDQKKINGVVIYDITVDESADTIMLDAKGLTITGIQVDGKEAVFSMGPEKEFMGQYIAIPVNPASRKFTIRYATSPTAEALQWLEPSQTAGKQHPYLFTQGQAILTRTWIPIQDSPGIRMTYEATVRVPPALMAVMSATNPQQKNADGVYTFKMDQPIPAYLIALAVGDLEFKAIGNRTGVYSEPSMVAAAANEFVDMEKMLEAAEALYGPYLWERYDVIVLPPSFPFGGMENPRLTFATPTIIAGDRSLVALIAHELAHSWSGNLVTNATWNDFWLNEGFTVYFEGRIMEALYGKDYSDMLRHLGHQSLEGTVSELDPKDTHLFLDLHDRNPDDGMSDIAYEKGAHFLMMLEAQVGRDTFDAFLRKYFDEHKFQSMTTTAFLEYLDKELIKPNNLQVNIDEWVYGPGLPANTPTVTVDMFTEVDEARTSFLRGTKATTLNTKEWSTHEWLHFINGLNDSLSDVQIRELDAAFKFTQSNNSEIQAAWYELAIRQGYGKTILPAIREFLVNVGRRKFLTPLYTALVEEGMKKEAQDIFAAARPNYHSVAYGTIEKIVN